MKENQKCINCYYYSHHYSKQGVGYHTVDCGHCMNVNNKDRRKKRTAEFCNLWEDIKIKKEERKKSIKETLEFMSARLEQISILLRDDMEK